MRKRPYIPTEDDYRNIEFMTKSGVSVEKISEKIGCSAGLVSKIRKELGIEMKREKKSKREIAIAEKEPLTLPATMNKKHVQLLNKVFR